MTQFIATAVFTVAVLTLFALYRDRKARPSKALWIPTIWVLIAASRPVTAWLVRTPIRSTGTQYLQGTPLDRNIYTALILAGIFVLLWRGRRVQTILRMNGPILLFFFYCAVSTLWSDYPGVALKRWVKGIGDLVMIVIILTDRNPSEAIKRLITRVGFILMPLSVILIKFYPTLGRTYEPGLGQMTYVGVTTNKNTLGMVCMLLGIGCVWLLIKALRDDRHMSRQLIALGSVLMTILWLLYKAHSATSLVCFLMGSGLILFLNMPGRARSTRVHFVIGSMVFAAMLALVLPGIFASAVHALGRNTSLSGRMHLWHVLLSVKINPWFGTGYSSFWLGDRLQKLWTILVWHANEAHNGYLEIYLNLGWIGVTLLGYVLLTAYRNGVAAFRREPVSGSLRLAYIVVAVVYNVTEAAFIMQHPVWIFFLLAAMALPEVALRQTSDITAPVQSEQLSAELAPVGIPSYGEIR